MIERLHLHAAKTHAATHLLNAEDAEENSSSLESEFSELLRNQGLSYDQPSSADAMAVAIAQAGLAPAERPRVVDAPRVEEATEAEEDLLDEGEGDVMDLEKKSTGKQGKAPTPVQHAEENGEPTAEEVQALTTEPVQESAELATEVEPQVVQLEGELTQEQQVVVAPEGVAKEAEGEEPVEGFVPFETEAPVSAEAPVTGEQTPKVALDSAHGTGDAIKADKSQVASEVPVEAPVDPAVDPSLTTTAQTEASKTAKNAEKANVSDIAKTIGVRPMAEPPANAALENAVQLMALRQAFEMARTQLSNANGNGLGLGLGSKGIGQQHGVSALTPGGDANGAKDAAAEKTSKFIPRPQLMRALERVDSALKEAARSKDGKTISLMLDPSELGKVKADVSLRDGGLHARLVPENAQVMNALRERAHELQASLRKLGLEVETVTVAISSESNAGMSGGSTGTGEGNSFQEQWSNLPGNMGQVAGNTIGNNIADKDVAGTNAVKNANTTADHWIA